MKKNIFAVCVFYLIALLLRYLTNRTGLLAGVSNTVLVTLLQGVGPTVGAVVAMILFRIKPVMSLQGVFSDSCRQVSWSAFDRWRYAKQRAVATRE